ncbi:SUF system NifU family Fe-S cluster assembly protein [Candidatus Marinamargulisbacteria bacterium SCGC AG-410-N11]|nr:SUF system NifU family Fe-S cluster assembly protein [Candidatus Marinamargulisbacteria bacterium SCGC AG-410-N11]
MSERLKQLYQEMILEHNKRPRNFKKVEPCSHESHGVNPLCGDDYYVFVDIENDKIKDIGFLGKGCAISKSSGSLMTESIKGKTITEVIALKNDFINLLTNDQSASTNLGKLKVFEGVKEFPARVKCAALVWRALEDAIETQAGEITTE